MKRILLLLTLTSCMKYNQESNLFRGGYSTNALANDYFTVSYETGMFSNVTNPAMRDQIIMQRAAELTIENGFTHFILEQVPFSTGVRCYLSDDAPQHAYCASTVIDYISNQALCT